MKVTCINLVTTAREHSFVTPDVGPLKALALALLFLIMGCGGDGSPALPVAGFKVEFGEQNIPTAMVAGETVLANVSFKNVSQRIWPSRPNNSGQNAVELSYHWVDRKGQTVIFDGLRTPLPKDLNPGESASLKAKIRAPDRAGNYILEMTLVQEGVAWFTDNDGGKITVHVNVVAANAQGPDAAGAKAVAQVGAPEAQNQENHRPAKVIHGSLPEKSDDARLSDKSAQATQSKERQDTRTKAWAVQAGSYSQEKDAEKFAKILRAKGYDAYVVVTKVKGKVWRQVRIGRLASKAEANRLQETLKTSEKLKQSFVVFSG